MSRATIMAVVNQKGGTGKTTTCENLGISIDASPGTATIWIRLDTGDKYARSKKYLEEILDILGYYDSRKVEIKF